MRRIVSFVVVMLLPLVGAGCLSADDPACTPTGTTTHRDVRYTTTPGVAARHQSLDLYLPVRDKRCVASPLVVYVHGGAFVGGDKGNQITDKVRLFTGEGWGFASINYRLVGAAGAGDATYPAAERDVAAAIAYLHEHAAQYRLDARHVMLLGHSAGAFLVALDSTDGRFLSTAGLDLHAITCAAPVDTTYDIAAQVAAGGTEAAMFRNAFGDDPAVWAQASPPNNVAAGKGIPAFHIVTRGTARRIAQSQSFGTTLQRAGVDADVQVVAGLTHEQVNDAIGAAGETAVTGPLMSFFRSCATR